MEREPVSSLQFPPGFRFHPSDEELITHYLLNKVKSCPMPAHVIADIELYNYNPWELPEKALFGEDEWYFFSPRDRKYPNGDRPNRTAASGYWKATGTDKPILTCRSKKKIGVRKSLVFYSGRPPKVVKTDWIMNEYRLPDKPRPSKLKGSMRLDDWVLCRVRQKGNKSKNTWEAARDSASKEPSEYFPNTEELPLGCISPDISTITYFGHEGSQVLAPILVDQTLPDNDNISSEIFQDSNDGNIDDSLHEDGSEKLNSPLAGTFIDIIFNETMGKYNEGSQGTMYGNLLPTINNNDNENLPQSNQLDSNDVNFYVQNQSERDTFNPNLLNAINGLEGLNECIFTGRFLQ